MSLVLTPDERAIAAGEAGDGAGMAMRIVAEAARLLGAPHLIPIASAHIDGALYHGDSGTLFAERLVDGGARVAVRSTLNVGALDLTGCSHVRLAEPQRIACHVVDVVGDLKRLPQPPAATNSTRP